MTATIAAAEWLEFLKAEYLNAFIRDGGSSIKFAVALDDTAKVAVIDGIARLAETAGYMVARVSAEDTKIQQSVRPRVLCGHTFGAGSTNGI